MLKPMIKLPMYVTVCTDMSIHLFGRHVELRQTLESVSRSCPLIERLFFESSKTGAY